MGSPAGLGARRPRALCAALGLALAAACSPGERAPRWVRLAEGFRPAALADGAWATPFTGGPPLVVEREPGGSGVWVHLDVERSAWTPFGPELPGVWKVPRPVWGFGAPRDGGDPQRLVADGRELAYLPFTPATLRQRGRPADGPPQSFCGFLDNLYLEVASPEHLPERARYSVYVDRGAARGGAWRVAMDRYACDAIPVWSGERQSVACELPAGSALSFATAAVAGVPRGPGAGPARVTFRVRLDGEVVFQARQDVGDQVACVPRRVVLPSAARPAAELRFEVDGPATVAAFLAPVVGPAAIGRPGERPWPDARPDVLLLLADTFRADNLAAYGGEGGFAPELDRFAAQSRVYARAWSPSSWTLPSQASMLSGLFPYEHGAIGYRTALPDDAQTVAELFQRNGYRTAAVTDGALVSHRFGLDQGFEWFDEHHDVDWSGAYHDSFASTRQRLDALLDADDGRPLFLFVQTYRVHWPYVASERVRREHAGRLLLDADWRALERALDDAAAAWTQGERLPDSLQPVAERMEHLYRAGVVDFDRAMGELLDALEARRFFDAGVLAFTSDHGEAFGEHGDLYHGTGVWETQVRIPLVLRGRGVAPGTVEHAASLVDLPHTLAELAGLAPERAWRGRSLLSLDADRPVFTFQCSVYEGTAQAIVDGSHKLILADTDAALEGAPREAYDLATDPHERDDRAAATPGWVGAVLGRHAADALERRRPAIDGELVTLTSDDRDELRRMGYVGDF